MPLAAPQPPPPQPQEPQPGRNKNPQKQLHIAPMLDVSTPEFLHLFRILSTRAILWTEMVVDSTILHSPYLDHHLAYDRKLSPIVCQIGGREGISCGRAARIVERYGYDEVNLNIDCPSNRVSCGEGGGCEMMSRGNWKEEEQEERKRSSRSDAVTVRKSCSNDKQMLVCDSRMDAGGVQSSNGCDNTDDTTEASTAAAAATDNDCLDSNTSKGGFGAILMKDVQAAISTIQVMKDSVQRIPISVKTRVGIEYTEFSGNNQSGGKNGPMGASTTVILDTLEYLVDFIGKLRECGCRQFVIHARKCVVGGLLSPAQNRIVPPLNYPRVYELCRCFPDCEFILNGGIPGLAKAKMVCYGAEKSAHSLVLDQEEPIIMQESGPSSNTMGSPTQHHRHTVPCSICQAPNGSCTVTATSPPDNLVGCMLGRACIENPAMFWDVDRYFYGEETNPCKNRREVLEKYCQYLEETYPRRCCDVDERKTSRLPAPKVKMFTLGGCHICKEFYGDGRTNDVPAQDVLLRNDDKSSFRTVDKITSRAIGRCLKPVRGLFFGLRGGKQFRMECDRLNKDNRIRNCGPGYILRKVMSLMPVELLDTPFVKTEDLLDGDISVHVSPVNFQRKG